jgi:ABC-type multidrug transport system ATPase subunit
MFGLEGHEKTFVKHLSGGQRKRLSIALEIINDPKIIFLDECTSGLDSASSYQCIKLLRQLVYKGHTIICTIHQPSTLMLEMFDHIYAVANGQCIYQGSLKNLLKFLKEIDFQCPQTYNPVDYLMEIANDIYGERNCDLINQIENGRNEKYCQNLKYVKTYESDEFEAYPTPTFNSQLLYLMQRNAVIIFRDFTYTYFRLFAHLFLGILVGFTFWQIGNDASSVFKDFRLLIGVMILLVYTSVYSQITLCEYVII